jgi:peptidoglycan/xylan/chitin deacetylase (PgdA/CDA1 family)
LTDKLNLELNKAGINGMFFVLRDAIRQRVNKTSAKEIQDLYKNQCVCIHGSEHKPHPKMINWKESIDSSLNLVQTLIPQNSNQMFFRPPYGQRSEEMLAYLTDHRVSILLWNIDSQDWNSKIQKERVADRVLTLMLLWRRGIILFHDIHDKVLVVLPEILSKTKSAGIHWKDCRKMN